MMAMPSLKFIQIGKFVILYFFIVKAKFINSFTNHNMIVKNNYNLVKLNKLRLDWFDLDWIEQ